MNNNLHPFKKIIIPEIQFIIGLYGLLLVCFGFLRALILFRNLNQAEGVPPLLILKSFIVGARFDLAIASYFLIPLFILLLLLTPKWKKRMVAAFAIVMSAILFLGIAEPEFYHEFESRFNGLVFEYLNHPTIVAGMIWDGYPIIRYLILWSTLISSFLLGLKWLSERYLSVESKSSNSNKMIKIFSGMLFLVLMVFASRGGFQSEPLRWGDAFYSQNTFANHLALNGYFTLGRSMWDKIYAKQPYWTKAYKKSEAMAIAKKMILVPGEVDLSSENFPILRKEGQKWIPERYLAQKSSEPVNIVFILMESFSARFVDALGANYGLTPAFDSMCKDGILFERAFSNGTHTHQGVYATLTSFPNLPGYEYLMKMMEANQHFSSLPALLKKQGYQTLFLYNGLFSWDNKEGFFRNHGMDRFIGTHDYKNPTFVDPVWGVSDYDVFMRANQEFIKMSEKGPFFAIILTLSNHSPFNLPDPLPFQRIKTGDDLEKRFNGIRYADWALGEFIKAAQKENYFRNTLFVITGDHGFGTPPMITEMRLERFHVPLLFYSPYLLKEKNKRKKVVASQVDIIPSTLGLLGMDIPHQSWGRNLFAINDSDPGFAVIKPSGGEEVAAIIEGDLILKYAPKTRPVLERFSLGFPPNTEKLPVKNNPVVKKLKKELRAYIEAAILALRERKIGVP